MSYIGRWITDTFFPGTPQSVEKQKDGTWWYGMPGSNIDFPYSTLFEIFRGVPHLRALIERKASMYSNARFLVKKTNTDEDEIDYDHHLNEVLTNPNKLQSWRQMLYMTALIKSIAGITFLYPGFGVSRRPSRLAFLKVIDFNDYEIERNKTSNFLIEDDVDQIIKRFNFSMEDGQTLNYKPSEVLAFYDTFSSYTQVTSRITTHLLPIQNIYKALVARGFLIEKKGGVGILSGNSKDSGMSVPLRPSEKKRLERRFNDHNIVGGKDIMVTDVPLKFQSTIVPTNQLMLFEEIVDDFNTLCDGWGMARELFVGDAAYASTRRQAETDTYNNTIVPEWGDFFNTLNDGLRTRDENVRIDLDVSHIAVLQKSESESVAVQTAKSNMYMKEVEKGIIDIATYRQQMGYEKKS